PNYVGKEFLVGKNIKGDLAIFSLELREVVLVLDSEKYFNCESNSRFRFRVAHSGDFLAVACNDSLVLINLIDFTVVDRILPFSEKTFESRLEYHRGKLSDFTILGVSFVDNYIVIHGDHIFPFLICIDFNDGLAIKWIYYVGGALEAKY